MRVVAWNEGRISTRDAVETATTISGAMLRDAYAEALHILTFGLVRLQDNAIRMGPVDLLRFGEPAVSRDAVEWPIEGGLLAGGSGGRWRIESSGHDVAMSVDGYRPAIPRPLYDITHLQVHLLFTRLFLLRLRRAEPSTITPASQLDRRRAGAVDLALCLSLATLTGRRRLLRRTLVIGAVYHAACWTLGGRTLGGLVMRQRVVAVDGSRLTPAQSLFRLALLPASWIARRPIHDELAATDVVSDRT